MENSVYKLLFKNQSIDTTIRYESVKETKMYVFLREITNEPQYIFRVNKKTLNIKGIKEGKDGYRFDVPCALTLTKIN